MNRSEVLAAVAIEFAAFIARTNIDPEDYTPVERMLFQAGFVEGARWAQERALNVAKEGQS
jgi:hypothetical protein